ncbi:uncharacterized protein LOC109144898 [Corvus cornix cornix]|uniref:uncharacterized protein LOC109144898 n=1 Tax=Corvus cornix cornix TaxID=932674 RepID=UPI000900B06C|nr:uncharacterized protein LOC109144898 [Corvus cornix cornix]
MTETPKGEKMDLKQLQEDDRPSQNEKPCPDASPEAQEAKAEASGEQVPSAGAESHIPALQSPCSPPGPSPPQEAAQTLSGQQSVLAAPESGEGAQANEEEERKVCSPHHLGQGQNSMEQELSQGEVNRLQKLSQGENNSDKASLHENWGRITIRTIWVNPQYPELLQDPLQEEAKAASPSASDEQVPAAGAQSPARDSPCCSPCSSQAQLAAQTLSDAQGAHRQPSSPRRALWALCTLLWCSCMEVQLDD